MAALVEDASNERSSPVVSRARTGGAPSRSWTAVPGCGTSIMGSGCGNSGSGAGAVFEYEILVWTDGLESGGHRLPDFHC